jgi:hypothetical protein
MQYLPAQASSDGIAKVIYRSKDDKTVKTFNALDWLAQLITHIPDKGEQMCRYYDYSNKSRGLRKKIDQADEVPYIMESGLSSKSFRRNWARMIQKVYNVDPLVCTKCQGTMRIIAFIEEDGVIKKILEHLNLWNTHNHDPPEFKQDNSGTVLPFRYLTYDDSDSQIPPIDYWTDF